MHPRLFALGVLGLVLAATPAFATVVVVPEPGTAALLGGAALAGVLAYRIRTRK